MREQIMMKLYETRDLTETAALCSHGHPLHRIEVENRWATFIVGYVIPDEEFQQLTDDYHRGELLVEAVDFARRRNEIAAKMRKALAEALPAQHAPERIRLRQGYGGQERSGGEEVIAPLSQPDEAASDTEPPSASREGLNSPGGPPDAEGSAAADV